MALAGLAAGDILSIGCGGGGGTGSSTATEAGSSTCGAAPPITYDMCDGTPFTVDGTCLDGTCASAPLEVRAYKEWKAQVQALSGLDEATFAARVKIQKISHTPGPGDVFVRIEYLVVLDWMTSRQVDTPQFTNMPLVNAPSDAQIASAVEFAVEQAEWTGLSALGQIAPTSVVRAAFEECACGITVDACEIDFENLTGKLIIGGFKQIDLAQNKCKRATVNVGTGQLERCDDEPCLIN
jgi:hypothetical protein